MPSRFVPRGVDEDHTGFGCELTAVGGFEGGELAVVAGSKRGPTAVRWL